MNKFGRFLGKISAETGSKFPSAFND